MSNRSAPYLVAIETLLPPGPPAVGAYNAKSAPALVPDVQPAVSSCTPAAAAVAPLGSNSGNLFAACSDRDRVRTAGAEWPFDGCERDRGPRSNDWDWLSSDRDRVPPPTGGTFGKTGAASSGDAGAGATSCSASVSFPRTAPTTVASGTGVAIKGDGKKGSMLQYIKGNPLPGSTEKGDDDVREEMEDWYVGVGIVHVRKC